MNFETISELIGKHILGTLSPKEAEQLSQWIGQSEDNRRLFERITHPDYVREKIERWSSIPLPEIPTDGQGRKKIRIRQIAAAAAVAVLLVTGGILLNRSEQRFQALKAQYEKEHYLTSIQPGVTKAMLTTQGGQTVVLGDDENRNSLAIEAARIRQASQDSLRRKAEADRLALNNLEIPRGGEFHITLEDGTEVWLNAESSLKYPDRFDGKIREVTLLGEAYFKVSKDPQERPFHVKTAGQLVRVHGTEFNIFSYDEDQFIYTTLVDGSISLMREDRPDSELILTPGHQAVFGKTDGATNVKPVATEVVTSWRNGMFVFEDQTLDQIMRQLSRWYNFTYSFSSQEAASTLFMGRMARSSKFGEVLEILEQSGHLKFDVKDNHIIISKSTNL